MTEISRKELTWSMLVIPRTDKRMFVTVSEMDFDREQNTKCNIEWRATRFRNSHT